MSSAVLAACVALWGSAAEVAALAAEGAEARVVERQAAATPREAIDESLARAFRELRAAEVGGAIAAVDEVAARWPDARAQARAQLARRAIEARGAATTAAALIAAEDALARERLELSQRMDAGEAAAARELVLESAEDLLLRRLAADGTDGVIAVGMPTAEQLADATALVARVDEVMARPLFAPLLARAGTAAVATDGAVFRASLLAGLTRALEADVRGFEPDAGPDAVAARERARAAAAAHLEVAARSELPIPREIACVLALARARTADPLRAADPARAEQRARLLESAAASEDAMRAFVARVEAWRMGSPAGDGGSVAVDRPFPTVRETGATAAGGESAMSLLAALAECRARREAGESLDRVAAPLERALRASTGEADRTKAVARLRRTAAAIALRLDAATRALVREDVRRTDGRRTDGRRTDAAASSSSGAAPVLQALVAISPDGADVLSAQADAMRAIAGRPLIAPWLAVPLARALREQGRADYAADVLVALLEAAPEVEGARDVAEIAIALSRLGAELTAGGELALDRALEVAARCVSDRAAHDAWTLERVDLALFPRHIAADATRAAEILQSVSTRIEVRWMREVRALEIEGVKVLGTGGEAGARRDRRGITPSTDARRAVAAPTEARRIADQAGALVEALAGGDAMLLSRAETIRAAATLASGRPAESCLVAALALEELSGARPEDGSAAEWIAQQTAARATVVWVEAALARDGAAAPPAAVRGLIERYPVIADAAAEALADAAESLERAIAEGDGKSDGRGDATRAVRDTAKRLQPIARLLAEAGPDAETAGALAVLADLAAGDSAAAEARASVVAERAPESRRARWLLAECLRARADGDGDEDARARSFALFRALAPMAADPRDDIWWRAQLGQLEILADDPATVSERSLEIRARLNRLAAIDPSLGGKPMAGRVRALRATLERAAPADTTRGSRTP